MKIAYVNSICQRHDAISNALRDEIRWLGEVGHKVRLFAYHCDHEEIDCRVVSDAAEVICDPFFKAADIVVFHFGVFYPLFDAIFAVPVTARKVVVFHNITPAEFLPSRSKPLIEKAFGQLQNARYADKVICVSQVNLSVLRDHGLVGAAEVVPLAAWQGACQPAVKPSFSDGVMRMAYIGRLVQSKGPMDLLALVRQLLTGTTKSLRVDLMFNSEMSDTATVDAVVSEAKAVEIAFTGRVEMALHPNGDNALKEGILADADVFCLPTRHEGFCVPIIEAMAAGCMVLSYANSNVPAISGGLAVLAPDRDLASFVRLGAETLNLLGSPAWRTGGYTTYAQEALNHVQQFSEHNVKSRFLSAVGAVSLD